MAKEGLVYAVATEDMDCLPFGSPILLREFSNKNEPVIEIRLDEILKGLDITMKQFIDICILCGCDYSDNIEGIGPITALKLIKEYDNIEGVLKYIEDYNKDTHRKRKYIYDPETFNYIESRLLFENPEALSTSEIDLKWSNPDYEGLKKFLCDEKAFNPSRIDSAMARIDVIILNIYYIFVRKQNQEHHSRD
jgi:flap endonuclease-1